MSPKNFNGNTLYFVALLNSSLNLKVMFINICIIFELFDFFYFTLAVHYKILNLEWNEGKEVFEKNKKTENYYKWTIQMLVYTLTKCVDIIIVLHSYQTNSQTRMMRIFHAILIAHFERHLRNISYQIILLSATKVIFNVIGMVICFITAVFFIRFPLKHLYEV